MLASNGVSLQCTIMYNVQCTIIITVWQDALHVVF